MFGQSLHGETEAPSFSWTYEEIKEVHKRWWQLRDNAVEIFLTNGRTLLLAFDNTKVRWKKHKSHGKRIHAVSAQEMNADITCDWHTVDPPAYLLKLFHFYYCKGLTGLIIHN